MYRLILVSQCPQKSPPSPPLALTPWFLPQQMDDAVYTFETLLHQELGKLQGKDDLCKSIQRILERVLKVRAGVCSCLGAPGGLHPRARSLGMRIRSLLGKHFFLTRLSRVLLGFGASGKAGGGPRGRVRGGPNTSAESQGERRVGHGWEGRGNPFSPVEMGPKYGAVPTPPCSPRGR